MITEGSNSLSSITPRVSRICLNDSKILFSQTTKLSFQSVFLQAILFSINTLLMANSLDSEKAIKQKHASEFFVVLKIFFCISFTFFLFL